MTTAANRTRRHPVNFCLHMTADNQAVLTADEFRRLMRRHRYTLGSFAARFDVTIRTVRRYRERGLKNGAAFDWLQNLTGDWSPRLRAAFRQWKRHEYDR